MERPKVSALRLWQMTRGGAPWEGMPFAPQGVLLGKVLSMSADRTFQLDPQRESS